MGSPLKWLGFSLIMGIAIGIPVLFLGAGVTIKFYQFIFSDPVNTGIPVWVIIIMGIALIYIFKRRSQTQYQQY